MLFGESFKRIFLEDLKLPVGFYEVCYAIKGDDWSIMEFTNYGLNYRDYDYKCNEKYSVRFCKNGYTKVLGLDKPCDLAFRLLKSEEQDESEAAG